MAVEEDDEDGSMDELSELGDFGNDEVFEIRGKFLPISQAASELTHPIRGRTTRGHRSLR